MQIGGTYEEMKKSFLAAYGRRQYDTLVEMLHVRMREGETATAFANRFRGMLPMSIKADHQLAKVWFLNKLPTELRKRKAIQIFEKEGTFKDLREECHEAYKQALSDRSSKRSRAAVNSVQDDNEEAEQEEDEPAAVNLVNSAAVRASSGRVNVLGQTRRPT